jgi:two-component system, OmpR family, response regulator
MFDIRIWKAIRVRARPDIQEYKGGGGGDTPVESSPSGGLFFSVGPASNNRPKIRPLYDVSLTAMSVLLIEDDLPLADGFARALRREGFNVDIAGTAGEACRALDAKPYGLVVVDLGLPDLDGCEVVRYVIAQELDMTVLVLSARDGVDERVRLLDIGADDFLAKPVAMDEFLARVRALLRRRRTGARLVLGRVSLDLEGKRAFLDGHPFDLNSRDWALIVFLAHSSDRVVTKKDIANALYGAEGDVSINAIDQIMSRFRRRLADTGLNLHTVRGLGYLLEVARGENGSSPSRMTKP